MKLNPQPVKFNFGQKLFVVTWATHSILVFIYLMLFLMVVSLNAFTGPDGFRGGLIEVIFLALSFPIVPPMIPSLYSATVSGYQVGLAAILLLPNSVLWAATANLLWRLFFKGRAARRTDSDPSHS